MGKASTLCANAPWPKDVLVRLRRTVLCYRKEAVNRPALRRTSKRAFSNS